MKNTKVVAISGASGAGKTTVVKQLALQFDCPFLLFDDHTEQTSYPKDMKNWLTKGAKLSLIQTPKLVNCLQNLKVNSGSRFIFVEEPFGRERDAISPLIDYVVLLDQPMELCLARIIKRHTEYSHSDSMHFIATYLDKYEDHYRDIYLSAVSQVRNNADLICQEVVPIKELTNEISHWLKNNTHE
jgi:uridine kinase